MIVLCADPPWEYEGVIRPSDAVGLRYPTMTDQDIAALPVQEWVGRDALLMLWCPAPKLDLGIATLAAWGFGYRSCWVWDKREDDILDDLRLDAHATLLRLVTRSEDRCNGWVTDLHRDPFGTLQRLLGRLTRTSGLGHYARIDHELLLIGKRGDVKAPARAARVSSVLRERRTGHSVKPRAWLRWARACYPEARCIELFARRAELGWEATGQDLDGRQVQDVMAMPLSLTPRLVVADDICRWTCRGCGISGETSARLGPFHEHRKRAPRIPGTRKRCKGALEVSTA